MSTIDSYEKLEKVANRHGYLLAELDYFEQKFKRVVTPEKVRTVIEKLESECATQFSHDDANYLHLDENHKRREIRADKWRFMLNECKEDPLIKPIIDSLDPSKMNKFCEDVGWIYHIICDEIHNCKFLIPEEPPYPYYILEQPRWKYAVDLLSSINYKL